MKTPCSPPFCSPKILTVDFKISIDLSALASRPLLDPVDKLASYRREVAELADEDLRDLDDAVDSGVDNALRHVVGCLLMEELVCLEMRMGDCAV